MDNSNPYAFRHYLKDLLAFLRRPDFKRGRGYQPERLTGTRSTDSSQEEASKLVRLFSLSSPHEPQAWRRDWQLRMPWRIFFRFQLTVWALNILVLLPVVSMAYEHAGVSPRQEITWSMLPLALLWAPLIEELMFRYILRRPLLLGIWLPWAAAMLYLSTSIFGLAVLLAFLWLVIVYWPERRVAAVQAKHYRWLRRYRKIWPYVLHGSVLLFALIHLTNYNIGSASYGLLPFLVLPQWLVGLVLAWMRIRFGIAQSIVFHAAYNALPFLLVGLAG